MMYTELQNSALRLAKALAAHNTALIQSNIQRDLPVCTATHTVKTYLDFYEPKGLSAHQKLFLESGEHQLLPLAQTFHADLEAALPSLGPLTWSLQTSLRAAKPGFTLRLWKWTTAHPTPNKVAQRLLQVADRMRSVRTGLRTFCVQPNQTTAWNLRAHGPEDALLAWHVMRFSTLAPTLERLEKVEAEIVETYKRPALLAALRAHHFAASA